jgi:hypothetical protein
MSKHFPACAVIISCLLATVAQSEEPMVGEVVGDIYTNCEYRFAAMFPEDPMYRDFTYMDGDRSAPAREFYVDRPDGRLSVTVAYFADVEDEEQSLIDDAAAEFRRRGEVKDEEQVFYDTPQVPGYHISMELDDGRILRVSTYTARQRLYISEATSSPTDIAALKFEQSVSFIDENGTDLDGNPVAATPTIGASGGLPSRQYDCSLLGR